MRSSDFIPDQKALDLENISLRVSDDGAQVTIFAYLKDDAKRRGWDATPLAYAVFDKDGRTLVSADTAVNAEYRRQGLGKMMYDHLKSLGFTIKASTDQLAAGQKFWAKYRGDQKVWEDL